MNLETKCPHCDQWTSSNVESCSKCGGLLFEPKQGANVHAYKILASLVKIIKGFVSSSISSLKKNWKLVTGLAVAVLTISRLKDNRKLVTGLAGAVLIFAIFFRPNPTPPPEKPDLSGQLGFYGQWDKDKDGYLDGTEIVAAMTELSKVDVNATDISGESGVVKFRWEPPRMDMDLDQRLSREELKQGDRRYFLFQERNQVFYSFHLFYWQVLEIYLRTSFFFYMYYLE